MEPVAAWYVGSILIGTPPPENAPAGRIAFKTGTSYGYRDAWFVGYTGNFSGAVWMGNDDYSPTKRMTGGTLPAIIWHEIMAYAHQGVELRPLPGLPPQHAPAAAAAMA